MAKKQSRREKSRSLTLGRLVAIADSVYPDGLVGQYFRKPSIEHGDTLAKFIMAELRDTYDEEATETAQLSEAMRVMDRAIMQLTEVRDAFFRAG